MRKHTALSWANCIEITEKEFNECLVELGYQTKNVKTQRWECTPKGAKHSSSFFRKLYWDVDVMFDVLNLNGLKTNMYFYCKECGAYNRIEFGEHSHEKRICSKCGFVVSEIEIVEYEEDIFETLF